MTRPAGCGWTARGPGEGTGTGIEAKTKALQAAKVAQDKKGQNLTVIGVEGLTGYTDFIVIATAYSDRQTNAIAKAVEDALRRDHGLELMGRDGRTGWIVLDYGDVVVHVFHEDTRAHYDLDKMWAKAPRLRVPPPERLHDREAMPLPPPQSGSSVLA